MSASPNGYHEFRRRVKLGGTVTLLTGLHIGRGRGLSPSGTDLPVLVDLAGRPFVPGSSLKGVLRSTVESWLRGLVPNNTGVVCRRVGDRDGSHSCVSNTLKRQMAEQYRDDPEGLDRELWARSCWVCSFFGSPWIASKLLVADLPVEGEWRREWLMVRDGVAIDRESETAATTLKYDFEAVPAGTSFALEMLVENPDDHELGMLAMALDLLNDGFALLGGGASRGLGRVRVDLRRVEVLTPEALLRGLGPKAVAPPAGEVAPSAPAAPPAPAAAAAPSGPDSAAAAYAAARECLARLGGIARREDLTAAFQAAGWPKARLQRAFQGRPQFNFENFFQLMVREGQIGQAFTLPGVKPAAPPAASPSPPPAAPPPAPAAMPETSELVARLRREWNEALGLALAESRQHGNARTGEEG